MLRIKIKSKRWRRSHVHVTVVAFLLAASFVPARLLSSLHTDMIILQQSLEWTVNSGRRSIPVFFNVYLKPDADEHEANRVRALVNGQLSHLIPDIHGPVFVRTIGKELTIPNTTHLGHDLQGNEERTLHSLWEYCRNHTNQDVVYLHSKGSFSNNIQNELFREFLTRTALSSDCNQALLPGNEIQCNVCGARFSPLPHPHIPGNMFITKCSYVAKLIDPLDFQAMMNRVPHLAARRDPKWGVGQDRFAVEHWIGSRGASLRPCDLYNSPSYIFGYNNIPDLRAFNASEPLPPSMFSLQLAPRFGYELWQRPFSRMKDLEYLSIQHRWLEYQFLYNETPPLPVPLSVSASLNGSIWWGWRLQAWVDDALAWDGRPPVHLGDQRQLK